MITLRRVSTIWNYILSQDYKHIVKVIEIVYFFITLAGNGGLERLISSHVEVSKIGRQIAEEVLDLQKRGEDSSSGSSPGPAVTEPALLNTEVNMS